MSRISPNQPVIASVLDRLAHQGGQSGPVAGGAGAAAHRFTGQSLRDLKQCIRRDLENLLNTRWRCTMWPPHLDELENSLANYGIPDFSGLSLGASASREELRHVLERAITRFEPRLRNVRVELVNRDEPLDRVLRFRINAVLHAAESPEPVIFDSALEPLSASFEVKGAGR